MCLAEFQLLKGSADPPSPCVDVRVDAISNCAAYNGVRAVVILSIFAALAALAMQVRMGKSAYICGCGNVAFLLTARPSLSLHPPLHACARQLSSRPLLTPKKRGCV